MGITFSEEAKDYIVKKGGVVSLTAGYETLGGC